MNSPLLQDQWLAQDHSMRSMRLDPVYCPLQPCVAPVVWPSADTLFEPTVPLLSCCSCRKHALTSDAPAHVLAASNADAVNAGVWVLTGVWKQSRCRLSCDWAGSPARSHGASQRALGLPCMHAQHNMDGNVHPYRHGIFQANRRALLP